MLTFGPSVLFEVIAHFEGSLAFKGKKNTMGSKHATLGHPGQFTNNFGANAWFSPTPIFDSLPLTWILVARPKHRNVSVLFGEKMHR